MPNNSTYIQHLHAFRGFAILNIVGAHAWSFMIFWTGDLSSASIKHLFWLTETLFHGSTLYFAIISGLLFSYLLSEKAWLKFFQSKLTNVILPYATMTCVITALYWQYVIQDPNVDNTLQDYLQVVGNHLVSGSASIHFWYIPVLSIIFLVTPLLKYIQHRSKYGLWLIAALPLFISRSPFPNFLEPQSFVFFIGAYALGMIIGQNYEQFKVYMLNHLKMILGLAIASTLMIYILYVAEYKAEGIFSFRQTLIYIQKVSIFSLVLTWFYLIERDLPKWLSTLGTYAFSIFFLHVIFIALVIENVQQALHHSRNAELILIFGSFNFIAGIIGSLLIAYLIKRGLGRHSKKLVGT